MGKNEKIKEFSSLVLCWANHELREFPWRRTKDPYKIIIAEIFLQRTKANQVEPIFSKFISKYPNFTSLDKASRSEIESEIYALGLKKRAEVLKRLAHQVLIEFSGSIPNKREELLKINGVGPYITNAVLCHAFGFDVPTVDVNFARVLSRIFALEIKQPAQKNRRIWKLAYEIMPHVKGQSSKFNLSIMDISDKFCKAINPECKSCPLSGMCEYRKKKTNNF